MIGKLRWLSPLAILLTSAMAPEALAKDSLLFIFDSSNSMWGQINGVAKIETARAALSDLVGKLPAETDVGLMVYGHRSKDACDDIELAVPIGPDTASGIVETLKTIVPQGKTPIANSLERSVAAFEGIAEGSKNIVLISDGIETCEGNACEVAARLAGTGVNVKVHVVGFDIPDKDRASLECIAEKGGGRYFSADSTEDFSEAIAEAVVVAQAETPAPEPTGPVRERVFFDDFEGTDLAEDWVVTNPNPDGYIVEAGNLLMVNGAVGAFDKADSANIIQLERDLPDGDWDIHVTFTGEFKTLKDLFTLGLRTDDKNFLAATVSTESYCCHYSKISLSLVKRSDGVETRFDKEVYGQDGAHVSPADVAAYGKVIKLTLSKRGRSYAASYVAEGDLDANGNQNTNKTDNLTSLRSPGKFALSAGKWNKDAPGEFLVNIDSVEIETVKAAP